MGDDPNLGFIKSAAAQITAQRLQRYGLKPSMSGKGHCYDNAAVETFFKSRTAELLGRQAWLTRCQAKATIFQHITEFYNARRRHAYLGGISPLAFEARVALKDQSPAQNRYKSNPASFDISPA